MFCTLLYILWFTFFWSLYFLSFDLRPPITFLVASNFQIFSFIAASITSDFHTEIIYSIFGHMSSLENTREVVSLILNRRLPLIFVKLCRSIADDLMRVLWIVWTPFLWYTFKQYVTQIPRKIYILLVPLILVHLVNWYVVSLYYRGILCYM